MADGAIDTLAQSMSQNHRLKVRLDGAEADVLQALRAIPDVAKVQQSTQLEAGLFDYEIEPKNNADLRKAVNAVAQEHGWNIYRMESGLLTLEDIFLKVTMGEWTPNKRRQSNMGAIYRRELGSFFNSAIGPVFLTVFYLGSGVLFWLFCLNYARTDMSNYFAWMRLVMVLILPLLTMRLLSEERAQKTDQGLLTAPVSLGGIVLGKYFAALTVYAMGIAIVFVYAILLSFFGTVAWSIVFSNFIALFLMGAAFMAITLFLSAFTANQFIAYVLGIVSLVVLYMIDYLSGTVSSSADSLSSKSTVLSTLVGWLGNAMESVSFFSRIYDFTYGLFNLSSVLLYISTAVLFNFFTVRVFETRRWR